MGDEFLSSSNQGYGCAGLIMFLMVNCTRNEKVDSSFRSACSVQTSLSMHAIYEFGSEEQKEFISQYGKGEKIGCFG